MNRIQTLVLAGALAWSGALPAAADNLTRDGFQSAVLANGVPVYFKANPNNKVLALKAFFRGGSTLMTPETAGYESLALTMLTRGSARYGYAQLKDLEWRTSASLTASPAGFDGASFGVVSLADTFSTVFDAWSDALLHPRWDPQEFARVVQDAKMAVQRSQQDPYSRAVLELHRQTFAGHPYQADFTPTAASLANATLDRVKAWWDAHLQSGRLVIVAVGNFDFARLKAQLDATVGTLPRAEVSLPPVPRWTTPDRAVIVPFAEAGDVGYVRADFPIPAVGTPDYDALALGFTVLDDILFDVVRAKYAACYSAWSQTYGFFAPYGSLVVYKSDQPTKVKAYLDEAIGLLASGKALASQASASAAGKGGLGEAPEPSHAQYVDLAQVIDFYRAKAINGFYENQQTNAAIAGQMASSVVYQGDVKAYLDYAARVKAVRAEDVVRVIRQYVQTAPKAWVVLASPELLGATTEADFLSQP